MTDHQAFDLLALFKTLMMKIGDKKDIIMFHGEIKIKISCLKNVCQCGKIDTHCRAKISLELNLIVA